MLRILLATDGSEGAAAAARFLAGLPHCRGAHVHLLTVQRTGRPHTPREAEEILATAHTALGSFPGHVTSGHSEADDTGEIVDQILATAEYADSDLIVVGTQGRSAVSRFFLGSTAETVARHAARASVLVVRGHGGEPAPPLPLREILCGIDGSKDAHHAARWVLEGALPLPPECAVRFVEVVPTPPVAATVPDALLATTYIEAVEEAIHAEEGMARERLAGLAAEFAGAGHPVHTEMRVGNPAAELADAAAEHGAGLIVVGAHGRTGLERFLIGSVSERLLRHAPCSVLVVRRPPGAAA